MHPITALQTEYSIFSRDIEQDILPTCRKLGVSLVAYSPLGRGMLTGRYASTADRPSEGNDFRAQMQPRFQPDNFASNLKLVEKVKAVAADNGCTPAQVALSWVISQGEDVVVIPGTTRLANLQSNLQSLDCPLSDQDLEKLDGLAAQVKGDRY